MGKILLDTNAYSGLLQQDQNIFSSIADSDTTYMPSVVIGELMAGFYGGKQLEANKRILNEFISDLEIEVTNIGLETAQIYGEIKNELRIKGTPVPINDVWIAACAIETGSVLISYDKHFLIIPGLRVWQKLKSM